MTNTATLLSTFDTEWIGVIHEQAPKFFSGYADETIRNRILLAHLRKNGRILLGANSPVCQWNIKFNQQPIQAAGDSGTLTFNRHDLQRQAMLNWRGYVGTDMMTDKEMLMNAGPGRILDRYGEIIPSLMEAMTDHFGGELFIDGNATGNDNRIHGNESFLAETTPVVGDLVAQPNDSYAGHSTVLGTEGGTWSTDLAAADRPSAALANDWPHGNGPVKYDYISPLLVNWSSTSWGTGTNTWESNCERALRQTVIWLTNRGGQKGRPKLFLMSNELYAGYLNHQEAKQRIRIPHRESEGMGFADAINQEGVALAYDFEVPSGTCYAFNVQNMELASLDKVLFGYKGPDFSIRDRAYLFYVGFWGNARYRPKHFAKLSAYASA